MSIADVTMDIQLIKSNILRNTLDSLAQSIHPRTGVVEGQVNLEDVMNTEVGGIIRARTGYGAAVRHAVRWAASLPRCCNIWTNCARTAQGISKAASGLDANALQPPTTRCGCWPRPLLRRSISN